MEPGCRNVVLLGALCTLVWIAAGSLGGPVFGFVYALILGLTMLPGLLLSRRRAIATSVFFALAGFTAAVVLWIHSTGNGCNGEACIGVMFLAMLMAVTFIPFGIGIGLYRYRRREPEA